MMRARPKTISRMVEIRARAGMRAAGAKLLRTPQ
jgi:hypothetical protein